MQVRKVKDSLSVESCSEEVAAFVELFISAAQKTGNKLFRLLCYFFLDCTVSLYSLPYH